MEGGCLRWQYSSLCLPPTRILWPDQDRYENKASENDYLKKSLQYKKTQKHVGSRTNQKRGLLINYLRELSGNLLFYPFMLTGSFFFLPIAELDGFSGLVVWQCPLAQSQKKKRCSGSRDKKHSVAGWSISFSSGLFLFFPPLLRLVAFD